jgi:hypothetical protein
MNKIKLVLKCLKAKNYKWALCHIFNKNIFQYCDKNIVDIIVK